MSYCLPPGSWGIWWKAIKSLHISQNEAKINPRGHGINVLWPTNKLTLWADTSLVGFELLKISDIFCWEKNWSYKEHMAWFAWILISPEQGIKLSKWITNWLFFLTLKWKRTNHWIRDVCSIVWKCRKISFSFFFFWYILSPSNSEWSVILSQRYFFNLLTWLI